MISIKRFFIQALVLALVLVFLVSSVVSLYGAVHEVNEIYDAELAQAARFISSLIENDADEARLEHIHRAMSAFPVALRGLSEDDFEAAAGQQGHYYEQKLAFEVWSEAGELRFSSHAGPPFAFGSVGFAEQQQQNQRWQTFMYHAAGTGLWVLTAQQLDIRRELILYGVLWPEVLRLVLVTLTAVILALLVVSKGLAPLRRLREMLSLRRPEDLAPLPQPGWPVELHPLVDTLNQLFQQVEAVRVRERRFHADAAHELRTPLAGVKVHLQNARQADCGDPIHWRGLEQAEASVDRLTRIVSQLLVLSRLEPQHQLQASRPVALADLLAELIGDLYLLAEQKQIRIELEGPNVQVSGVGDLLAVLFRNLIENALRYTPEQGLVLVRTTDTGSRVEVSVEDSGPGIASEHQAKVMDRFYRLDKGCADGAGLGLSIVAELVRLHRAELTLKSSDRLGGLRAVVGFPRSG